MSEAVPVTPPAAPPPALPAKSWPDWFAPFDIALAILVLVPAFLAASHAARNTDVWPVLAAGRLVSEGGYSFGVDPFSYATAGRYWVNHAWLSGSVGYQLLKADPAGGVLVGVKAALFALAFGIGLLARKPGQSLWPAVVFALAGVVAAAPHSGLRPMTLSATFLATTLWILMRPDRSRGGLRNSLLLGGLFALWVNCDAWFVLGPVCVLLVLLGELIQKKLRGESEALKPLALALVIGVGATLLNPHFVRAWQAPAELGLGVPVIVTSDPAFKQQFLSPVTKDYTASPLYGYNANGAAFAGLLLAGGALFGLGFARVRFAYVLLWVAFSALALVQYRLILFFAVTAGPLAAAAAAAVFSGPITGTGADVMRWVGSFGRMLTLPVLVLLCVVAYPGWLHPGPGAAVTTPRVEWSVAPDPGTVRTAQLFAAWRKAGKIPADSRGLLLDPTSANVFAYFAPEEKVFANTRFAFHAPEFPDLIKARRALTTGRSADDPYDLDGLSEVCDKLGTGFVTYGPQQAGFPPDLTPALTMIYSTRSWKLWHLDGRAVVLGRPGQAGPAFDPVKLAFDPAQKPTPSGAAAAPSVRPTEWAEKLFYSPKPVPLEVGDAVTWQSLARRAYSEARAPRARILQEVGAAATASGAGMAAFFSTYTVAQPPDDDLLALELLSVRAARAATAANTDVTEPYLVLASAYAPSELLLPGIPSSEAPAQELAALRQLLDRVVPAELAGKDAARQIIQKYQRLGMLYEQGNMLEWSRDARKAATPYMERFLAEFPPDSAERKQMAVQIEQFKDEAAKLGNRQFEQLELAIKRENPPKPQQVAAYLRIGFPGKALKLAREIPDADWPPGSLVLRVDLANVLLAGGKLPEAEAEMLKAEGLLKNSNDPSAAQAQQRFNQALRTYWRLTGNMAKVGEALDESAPKEILSPADLAYLRTVTATPLDWQLEVGGGMHGAVAGGPAVILGAELAAQGFVNPAVQLWSRTADYCVSRGVVSIFEGDIPAAKARFTQALSPGGMPLPRNHPVRPLAEKYLKLIADAEAKP